MRLVAHVDLQSLASHLSCRERRAQWWLGSEVAKIGDRWEPATVKGLGKCFCIMTG